MSTDRTNDENEKEKEKHCSCMNDAAIDLYPKIYRVSFRVYGVDPTGVKHIASEVNKAYIIGLDVEDVINRLKSNYTNTEFNNIEDGAMYHIVGQDITVYSVKYIGMLHDMTSKSMKYFEIPEADDEIPE